MHEDPIAVLERELVGAARRRAGVADEGVGSHEPRGPWPVAPGPVRRRSSLGAFAAVVLAGVAVVVVLGALVSLRGHRASLAPASSRPAAVSIPGRAQLIRILGVLRRPQTSADMHSGWMPSAWGPVDSSLVRRATVTPWGSSVFLIPLKPGIRTGRREAVSLLAGSGGGCCATAADIIRYGDMVSEGAGRSFAGGSTQTRLITVVPDGVAVVDFVLPRQSSPSDPGAPIYRSELIVAATVHGNVAAVQVRRECCMGGPAMIWKAPDGHVIRQIGNVAGANRVVAPPHPGPETTLSRAAERDPSTPNRVWVTPSVGGPHTVFKLHFLVLLSDADYSYRLSGTRCPAITPNGGDGGGTQDLRGATWSDSVDAVAGQSWCPGTYHLSATIMDLGHYGNLKHPARPFGTATFTVKP